MSHYLYPITIEQTKDSDYQQTLTLIYQVGLLGTYKHLCDQIVSSLKKESVYHSFESTIFQTLWNNRNNENNYFYVAKDNDRVIGMIYATIEKDNFYNTITQQYLVLTISEMYILPIYQNKGLGQHLITTVINSAKKDHPELNTVILRVVEDNAQAIQCYKKAGFTTTELVMYKKI
jgi:RimJ/RimL family protein N-acetyltransferase